MAALQLRGDDRGEVRDRSFFAGKSKHGNCTPRCRKHLSSECSRRDRRPPVIADTAQMTNSQELTLSCPQGPGVVSLWRRLGSTDRCVVQLYTLRLMLRQKRVRKFYKRCLKRCCCSTQTCVSRLRTALRQRCSVLSHTDSSVMRLPRSSGIRTWSIGSPNSANGPA